MKFYHRILDYRLVTSYSVFGALVYDAIVERLSAWRMRSAGQRAGVAHPVFSRLP